LNIKNINIVTRLNDEIQSLEDLRLDGQALSTTISVALNAYPSKDFSADLRKLTFDHLTAEIEKRKLALEAFGVVLDRPEPPQPTPPVFVSYEMRPCVLWEGEIRSYQTYELATQAIEDLYFGYVGVGDSRPTAFWTLYGRGSDGLALAIGDFKTERATREVAYRITKNPNWLSPDRGLATE